jgi:hypothetical protein
MFSGRWTEEEHRCFVKGLSDPRCGRDWRSLSMLWVRLSRAATGACRL